MVNLVSPLSSSQVQFWHGLWAYEDEPRLNRQARQRVLERRNHQSGLRWMWASNGEVPRSAVKVGKFYVGRAHHQGSVTPGKIDQKKKACLIPWGGDEHKKKIYEVLCTAGEFFTVNATNTEALLRASSAGISENGEPLFIGVVEHEGALVCGKVQRSHGVCYIGSSDKELTFHEYQVFVANPDKLFDNHYWMSNDATDLIPQNALLGGIDENGILYVGRTGHRGSLTPGGISSATQQCYIAWGSEEHRKSNFDYLCNCKAKFVPSRGNNVPVGAVQGGYSEFGEPLFVGRVKIGRFILVGKVQPSHSVCYIAYRRKEVAHGDYEILVLEQ
ncbi:uncharacterized protein LOC129775324 [Toxorhynchites rutilus septentrionalis]|uniref:uncharacterized protein LOC129775324 n=1 Tax=Toxorhynchites rutilus septentrionalis TaxID=329112 RepID=UPI00247ADB84|nr:uncharacterized protein LOC129775324 [Toxorhynchites rutilus septentrionalis]